MNNYFSIKVPVLKRGGFTTSKSLAKNFNGQCINSYDISDEELYHLRTKPNEKVIFLNQAPHMYKRNINFIKQLKNDIYFIRDEHSIGYKHTISNGFSYHKQTNIKNYMPVIHNHSLFGILKDYSKPVFGFYNRPQLLPDSMVKYNHFMKENPGEYLVMGTTNGIYGPSVTQINDSVEFFKRVTHFIYFKSGTRDPFPNTVLEAAQCNCHIIIPNRDENKNKDGVYDLIDILDVRTKIEYNETNHLYTDFNLYKPLMQKIIDNEFHYELPIKYKNSSYREFLEGEL